MNDFKSDIPEEFRRLDELERKATLAPWRASSYSSVVGCAIMAQPDPKKNSVLIGGTHGPLPRAEIEANAAFHIEARNTVRPLLDKLSESITRQETASKNAEFYANETVKLEARIAEYKLEVDRLRQGIEALKSYIPTGADLDLFHDCKGSDSFYGEIHHRMGAEIPAMIDDLLHPRSDEPVQLLDESDIPF